MAERERSREGEVEGLIFMFAHWYALCSQYIFIFYRNIFIFHVNKHIDFCFIIDHT